jgi:pimeloyl-ACP methyl ester carboxylesterase
VLPTLASSILQADPARREQRILAMTSTYHRDEKELIQTWVKYAEQHPVSRINALRQLVAAAKFRAPADKPSQPILLLSGLQDRLVNPICSQNLAGSWQLPHHQHPNAGHDLPLDAPDWVCQQIERHIQAIN